jgi:hypothetical protein
MNYLKALVILAIAWMFVGCAAHSKYYYERQTRNLAEQKLGAKIDLNAGLGEYKDTLRERTIEKYRQAPMYGDPINGFDGIVHNTKGRRGTFHITGRYGIDAAPISLACGDTVHQLLMPDVYNYEIIDEYGNLRGWGSFKVGPRIATYVYNGKPVRAHWFLYW